jgi:hypothetical protein
MIDSLTTDIPTKHVVHTQAFYLCLQDAIHLPICSEATHTLAGLAGSLRIFGKTTTLFRGDTYICTCLVLEVFLLFTDHLAILMLFLIFIAFYALHFSFSFFSKINKYTFLYMIKACPIKTAFVRWI